MTETARAEKIPGTFNFVKRCLTPLIFVLLSGCGFGGGARARVGYLPTATFGVKFSDPDRLGKHSSGFNPFEVGGIVYTCKAGHVDLDHVRGNADLTRYLAGKVRRALSSGAKGFSFSVTGELSSHKIAFTYPVGWGGVSDKERVIEEISLPTAAYLAYNATIWHEVLTWFGVHFVGFEPEFNSAFSWEDVYSNLIGTRLGVEALKDTGRSFDEAMTIAIDRQLRELKVQPKATAVHASDKVRGYWYTGNFVPDTRMRNFDIGLDGTVTPTLVPGIAGCDDEPLTLPVPTLEVLEGHGFSMRHEVRPNVLEQGRIFRAAGSKTIVPVIHYPVLLEYMKRDADRKGYMYDE